MDFTASKSLREGLRKIAASSSKGNPMYGVLNSQRLQQLVTSGTIHQCILFVSENDIELMNWIEPQRR